MSGRGTLKQRGTLAQPPGSATSQSFGTLASRPTATGSKNTYVATDVAGGTRYVDTAPGVWTQDAAGVNASILSRLISAYGATNGFPNTPQGGSPTEGPNLWLTPTTGENTSQTPSITANGTSQTVKTRIRTPVTADQLNGEVKMRITWDVSCSITSGWAGLSYFWADNTGVIISGQSVQYLFSTQSASVTNYKGFVEVTVPANAVNLEIQLAAANNAASGVLAINSMDIRRIGYVKPPMMFGWTGGTINTSGAAYSLYIPLVDPVSKLTTWKQQTLSTDGVLETAIQQAFVCVPGSGTFSNNPVDGTGTQTGGTPTVTRTGGNSTLHINNNGQVMNIWTGSASELRGNTHGGEVGRTGTYTSDFIFEYDLGDGVWRTPIQILNLAQFCRRFRFTLHTKFFASAAGSGSPYANCDAVWTFFDDGTVRQDRTVTFLQSQAFTDWFAWMSTFGSGTRQLKGKMGAGSWVHGTVDTRAFLNAPTISSVTTSTTGGTLPAATYNYRITAVTLYGETTASAKVAQATTGSTSSNTVNFPAAQSNQTAWRVYNDNGLLATVPATATSWVDTGATGGFGQPPTVNGAWNTGGSSFDSINSTLATWAVFYDPALNVCHSLICNPDDIIAQHPTATNIRNRLMQASGITKIYVMVENGTGYGTGTQASGEYATTIANGTVITNTSYAASYVPKDTSNFEVDQVARATNPSQLAVLYPSS